MRKPSVQLALIILLLTQAARAQSFVTVDGSQAYSTFKFTSTAGETAKEYTSLSAGAYSIGYRAYKKMLFIRANAGPRKAGAAYNASASDISWSLNYLDIRVGGGVELDKWRLKPFLSAGGYYSMLMKGQQQMDGLVYDLKKNKEIKPSDYGIAVIPGLRLFVSDAISIYTEFAYLQGLQNIETDPDQKLYNTSYSMTLGLAINMTKSKPKWLQ